MVLAKKKKPKKSAMVDVINQILEMANTSSKTSFTPADIQRLYMEGMKARQKREPELAQTTPKRVAPEGREEKMMHLDPRMKPPAVDAAVDLAVQLEMASAGDKLNLRKWVKG